MRTITESINEILNTKYFIPKLLKQKKSYNMVQIRANYV